MVGPGEVRATNRPERVARPWKATQTATASAKGSVLAERAARAQSTMPCTSTSRAARALGPGCRVDRSFAVPDAGEVEKARYRSGRSAE